MPSTRLEIQRRLARAAEPPLRRRWTRAGCATHSTLACCSRCATDEDRGAHVEIARRRRQQCQRLGRPHLLLSLTATRWRRRRTTCAPRARAWASQPGAANQYSCLMTKYDPRIVPASFDLWRANLKRDASSAGISIPSDSLKPTARFSAPSTVYITFTDSPLS